MKRGVAPEQPLFQDGALPHERLELFRDRLNVVFGNRARFMVLSGQEEAWPLECKYCKFVEG